MQITAAVTREKSAPFTIEELEVEEPRDNEVLVRVVATGVCHTDMIVRDQYFPVPLPAVLGHEASGVVERIGSAVRTVEPGDHVVLTWSGCGHCRNCLRAEPAYCENLFAHSFGAARVSDGSTALSKDGRPIHSHFFGQSSFATYSLAPEEHVIKVDKSHPLELLGPLGCGIQTGAGAVLEGLKPQAGSSIAIYGAGGVGMSAVMAAAVVGCTTIIAVDINESRRDLARELGATHTVDPAAGDVVAAVQSLTGGTGVDYALETTARPDVLRAAFEAVHVRGVCALVGAAALGTEVTLDMGSILFGRTLRGCIEGDSVPGLIIPKLLALHDAGRFPFDRLIKFYDFADINQAVADSEQGVTIKPVVRMP